MNQHMYEKMVGMRMPRMAQAYQKQTSQEEVLAWSFEERLALMIDAEYDNRHRNKIE